MGRTKNNKGKIMKIKKMMMDLEIDCTAYIPGEEGIVRTDKTTPQHINDWQMEAARIADKMQEDIKECDGSLVTTGKISKKAVLDQVDWFYDKGEEFWSQIPFSVLKAVLEHLNKESQKAQKK